MAGPLEAAGAQVEPNATAPLHTNEFFTGMLTQGNPLGPGAVPYLYTRFYGAGRFDRLIGGLNAEISPALTLRRRYGHSVYNNINTLTSPAQRLYQFRGYNTAGANNRLLADLGTTVNDVTAGGNVAKFTKSAGAGRTAFQTVGNTCYMGNGVDLMKTLYTGKSWVANTVFNPGDIITDPNGNLQVIESFLTLNIVAIQIITNGGNFYAIITFANEVRWTVGTSITFTGLTVFPGLNGLTKPTVNIGPLGFTSPMQAGVQLTGVTSIYGPNAESGSATSQVGVTVGMSGGSAPAWGAAWGNTTIDNNIVWRNYGQPTYPWAPAAPPAAPIVTLAAGIRLWQTLKALGSGGSPYAILDTNSHVQITFGVTTGVGYPDWAPQQPGVITHTADGNGFWEDHGPVTNWAPNLGYTGPWSTTNPLNVILDTNGNWQYASTPGISGATPPASWATAIGATTPDNTITWTCLGPGTVLLTAARNYSYAYHQIGGGVSTISPTVPLNLGGGPVVGAPGSMFATLTLTTPSNLDCDQLWVFANAQGGSIPLFLSIVPVVNQNVTEFFQDQFPDSILDEDVAGPQAHANDPPPAGFIPCAYHLGRVWGFVNGVLYYSGGPLVVVGNPNESFPPANNFQLPSIGVAAWATAMGLIVFRNDGISVVLGNGTTSSPLYVVNIFDGVGLASRDAMTTRGNTVFLMTTTGKVLRFSTAQFISAVEGQISQALPDDEIGFPIGDLLGALTPQNVYLAWLEGPSSDTGLFVANGASGFYMMRVLTQPEQATPWSPFAQVVGGIGAILSVQTAPGVNSLIVATPGGPLWKRDQTVFSDNGTAYPAFADIGVNMLAPPGQTAAAEFFVTDERKIAGATPLTLSALYDEISGTPPLLTAVTNDPPNLPQSVTVKSQRFWASPNASPIQICRFLWERVTWATEAYQNELFTNTIFGKVPSKTRK